MCVRLWCSCFLTLTLQALASAPAQTPKAAAGDAGPENTHKPIEVTIRPGKPRPAFQGWGTSLCWWAHGVGDWPDEPLDELIDWIVNPKTGLGYTVFRYNIGGGDDPSHDHMRRHGNIPGFRSGTDVPYDWTADGQQRRVLKKLVARVDKPILEAFSNSPPYWMTVSGCSSGNVGGKSNLRPDQFEAFAAYLADVAQQYRDEHGITFRTLNPLNEPNAGWWTAGHNQEGCHFEPAEQGRIIRALRKALDEPGLARIQVSAPDANSINTCLANIRSYNPQTLAALGQINTHSYAGDQRSALRKLAGKHGKRLWQSESGPLSFHGNQKDAALLMAQRVVRDLNEMQPAAWLEWQVVAGGNWGCIHIDRKTKALRRSPTFHAYAAFTRFIRPGDQLLTVDSQSVAAAFSVKRHELVMVVVNASDKAQAYRLRITGLSSHDDHAAAQPAFHGAKPFRVAIDKDVLGYQVAPKSIVTLRVSGARVTPSSAEESHTK